VIQFPKPTVPTLPHVRDMWDYVTPEPYSSLIAKTTLLANSNHLILLTMLKITDADGTKVYDIPTQLARSVGVFKDMVECISDGGVEPVLYPVIP
jgi:hypothetical protein